MTGSSAVIYWDTWCILLINKEFFDVKIFKGRGGFGVLGVRVRHELMVKKYPLYLAVLVDFLFS